MIDVKAAIIGECKALDETLNNASLSAAKLRTLLSLLPSDSMPGQDKMEGIVSKMNYATDRLVVAILEAYLAPGYEYKKEPVP